jgi:hypothetical protein
MCLHSEQLRRRGLVLFPLLRPGSWHGAELRSVRGASSTCTLQQVAQGRKAGLQEARSEGQRHDGRKAQRGLKLEDDLVNLGVHVPRQLPARVVHPHPALECWRNLTRVRWRSSWPGGCSAAEENERPKVCALDHHPWHASYGIGGRAQLQIDCMMKHGKDRWSRCPCRRPTSAATALDPGPAAEMMHVRPRRAGAGHSRLS